MLISAREGARLNQGSRPDAREGREVLPIYTGIFGVRPPPETYYEITDELGFR